MIAWEHNGGASKSESGIFGCVVCNVLVPFLALFGLDVLLVRWDVCFVNLVNLCLLLTLYYFWWQRVTLLKRWTCVSLACQRFADSLHWLLFTPPHPHSKKTVLQSWHVAWIWKYNRIGKTFFDYLYSVFFTKRKYISKIEIIKRNS